MSAIKSQHKIYISRVLFTKISQSKMIIESDIWCMWCIYNILYTYIHILTIVHPHTISSSMEYDYFIRLHHFYDLQNIECQNSTTLWGYFFYWQNTSIITWWSQISMGKKIVLSAKWIKLIITNSCRSPIWYTENSHVLRHWTRFMQSSPRISRISV